MGGSMNAIGKLNQGMMQQQQMAQQMGQMQQGVPGAQMGEMGPMNATPDAAFMQAWHGGQNAPMQVGMMPGDQFTADDAMMQQMPNMQQHMQQNMMQQNMMQQNMQQQPVQQEPQQEQPKQEIKPIKELPNERDLDEAQTRRLTHNVVQGLQHDDKMKGSKFIEFIHKMSTGELEIKDGELIHHDGPQMLPGTDWANEFDTGVIGGQTVVNPDEWSQEYADGAWAQEFQSQGPAQNVAPRVGNLGPWAKPVPTNMPQVIGDGVTIEPPLVQPSFAEVLQKNQTDWAEEFTDGDALCLNPNPLTGEPGIKHKFTLPNPFQDDETPYDTAMGFYAQGDLPNAILAFEAELMKNGNNEDAKFQLASAIILAKS